ncbi:MAG: hypothetical protein ACM3NI_04870 [Bacteroidota bacterium]
MFSPQGIGTMDKRQQEIRRMREVAQDFSTLTLTPDNLHAFYVKFINLRFPMQVAHLLELRYLINHAVDRYKMPPMTQDYRQFRDSLQGAIDSFIDNQRYSERMLKILSMLRDLHYTHSVNSRNAETRLREDMAANRAARDRAVRYGLFFILAGVACGIVGLAMKTSGWMVELLAAGNGYIAWRFFHKLPGLDRQLEKMTHELNDVLRRRVQSLNWRVLIHKLALVLGYKRVPGVEVFHIESEHDHPPGDRVYH